MILKLKDGNVEIELFEDKAPNHVKRFKTLANEGKYDGVVFHRVIEGFMAQTGDIKYGNSNSSDFNLQLAGMNRKLNNNIETIFLMSDVENQIISSRFVKEIVRLNGDIKKFTTKSTIKSLKEKYE